MFRKFLFYSIPLCGGRGGPSKTVDEDVGSCSTGKCFGVRLRAGVRYSFVGRGLRTIDDRPYGLVGSRRVCEKGIAPRGLSGRPVPTGLWEFYNLCADGEFIADHGPFLTSLRELNRPYEVCENNATTIPPSLHLAIGELNSPQPS